MYKTLFSVCLDVVDYVTKDDDDMMCFFSVKQPAIYIPDRPSTTRAILYMFYFRQPQQGGGWPIVMLENRLKPSEEGRGRR